MGGIKQSSIKKMPTVITGCFMCPCLVQLGSLFEVQTFCSVKCVSKKIEENSRIKNIADIPDWCPLEDAL